VADVVRSLSEPEKEKPSFSRSLYCDDIDKGKENWLPVPVAAATFPLTFKGLLSGELQAGRRAGGDFVLVAKAKAAIHPSFYWRYDNTPKEGREEGCLSGCALALPPVDVVVVLLLLRGPVVRLRLHYLMDGGSAGGADGRRRRTKDAKRPRSFLSPFCCGLSAGRRPSKAATRKVSLLPEGGREEA